MTLSLKKSDILSLQKDVQLVLEKKNLTSVKARVVFVADKSGSMHSLYHNGQVQLAAERVLALGSKFDPKGSIDLFSFNHSQQFLGSMNTSDFDGFIKRKVGSADGGTNYAPVINEIVRRYGNSTERTGGFFGFGSKTIIKKADMPTLVLFLTDGDNADRTQAEEAIKQASCNGIFFQFIGIGYCGFNFLRHLDDMDGRFIDNANFFELNDSGNISDEELYDRLLGEFPSWIELAKSKGLI